MKVQCTNCESKYNIKDEKIPDAGANIKCPKCHNIISVRKPEPKLSSLSSEDLTADLGNESDKADSKDEIKSKTKKCPYCAEEIHADAIKCKHCNSDFVENKAVKTYKNSKELFGVLLLICPLLAIFLLWSIRLPFFHIIIILSTIITTAILAAIEASQLNFGTTPSGKKETGPIGFFLGILLLWVISYPFYFYKRWKKGKKNFVFGSIIIAVLFVFSMGTSGYSFGHISKFSFGNILNPNVAMVKNGTLSKFPQTTVGNAIEGFLGNPQWKSITATDGNPYVNVEGKIQYDGKEATVAIQFRIYKERDTFEINALKINDEPQNVFVITALLDKMYENAKHVDAPTLNPIKRFADYRNNGNCASIENEANNTAAALSSYFADPSNFLLPTVEQLQALEGWTPQYPTQFFGSLEDGITILVSDENNICRKGQIYSYVMGSEYDAHWIK